ncbi:MAG: DUF4382 domain-containing protein, partial [Planctomycetes bacterium]|nr:DUF4382 domain-containing protein [Planctomycetota bacterium]
MARLFATLCLCLLGLLASCGRVPTGSEALPSKPGAPVGDAPGPPGGGMAVLTGRLVLHITDAPALFDQILEANVTVTRISARRRETPADPGGFVTLGEETRRFNLLELRAGLTATLVDTAVPTGSYDEVRLVISEAAVLLRDGRHFPLKTPSADAAGIKLKVDPAIEIQVGIAAELLLDFDVSRSFVFLGPAKAQGPEGQALPAAKADKGPSTPPGSAGKAPAGGPGAGGPPGPPTPLPPDPEDSPPAGAGPPAGKSQGSPAGRPAGPPAGKGPGVAPGPKPRGPLDDIHGVLFKPVIRVVNLSNAGRIEGLAQSDQGTPDPADDVPLRDVTVTAIQGAAVIAGSASDSEGRYVLVGLPAGSYDVGFQRTNSSERLVSGVVVTAGSRSRLDVTLQLELPGFTSFQDGDATGDPSPTVEGVAPPGAQVELLVDGLVVATTFADASGRFSLAPAAPLADGVHFLSLGSVDPLTGDVRSSTPVLLSIDRTPPAAPLIDSPLDPTVTVLPPARVSGRAESGTTVEVLDGETVLAATTATDGRFDVAIPPLAPGVHVLRGRATDRAGNLSQRSFPVTLYISETALVGRILDADTSPPAPIVGVEMALGGTALTAPIDLAGRFVLLDVPAGTRSLAIQTGRGLYPSMTIPIQVVRGQVNRLAPLLLPRIDPASRTAIPLDPGAATLEDVVLTSARVPGVELSLAAGTTVVFPPGVPAEVVLLPLDPMNLPVPLPPGSASRRAFDASPAGATLSPGASLRVPNNERLSPGAQVAVLHLDAAAGGWVEVGKGTVTPDGAFIETGPIVTSLSPFAIASPGTAIDCDITLRVLDREGRPFAGLRATVNGQSMTDAGGGLYRLPVAGNQPFTLLEGAPLRALVTGRANGFDFTASTDPVLAESPAVEIPTLTFGATLGPFAFTQGGAAQVSNGITTITFALGERFAQDLQGLEALDPATNPTRIFMGMLHKRFETEARPRILAITTPTGDVSQSVGIPFRVADSAAETSALDIEFSVGGAGFSAASAGLGGDPTAGLATAPGGKGYIFLWDALADLGAGTHQDVVLRIRPTDASGNQGAFVATGPFRVDHTVRFSGGDFALLPQGADPMAVTLEENLTGLPAVTVETSNPAVFRLQVGATVGDAFSRAQGEGFTLVGQAPGRATLRVTDGASLITERIVVVWARQHAVAADSTWPYRNAPDTTQSYTEDGAHMILGSGIFRFAWELLPRVAGRNGQEPDWWLAYHSRATSTGGPCGTAGWSLSCYRSVARAGSAIRYQDELGRQFLFDQDLGGGRLTARSRYEVLTETPAGVTIRQPDGTRLFFHPLPQPLADRGFTSGAIREELDRFGDRIQYAYDAFGRLVRLIENRGRAYSLSYDAANRLTRIEEQTGLRARLADLQYDADGLLERITTTPVTAVGGATDNTFEGAGRKRIDFVYDGAQVGLALKTNLLHVIYPNEVAAAGTPRITNVYGTDAGDPASLDRVTAQSWGGTNATGEAAGGSLSYRYGAPDAFRDATSTPPEPAAGADVVLEGQVTDRNGNQTLYRFDAKGLCVERLERTNRDLRPGDPPFYHTRYSFNADEELTLITYPIGNTVTYRYDTANPNRFARGNLLEVEQAADARGDGTGGTPAPITWRYTYEPMYQELRTTTDPRGNDPGFDPQPRPAVMPLDFNLDGDFTDAGEFTLDAAVGFKARYSTLHTFDYQELDALSILELADREGIDLDLDGAGATLSAHGVATALALGADVNQDGTSAQARGRVIRRQAPNARLADGTTQTALITDWQYNDFGQLGAEIDALGHVDRYRYYPLAFPSGPPAAVAPDPEGGGYLRDVTLDSAQRVAALRTPPAVLDANGVQLPPVAATTTYGLDAAGNVTLLVDPRGVTTTYTVNERNQTQEVLRAAAVQLTPEEASREGVADFIAPLGYLTRYRFDANDNITRRDVANRVGATPADVAGNRFIVTATVYDILDNPLEVSQEVAEGETVTIAGQDFSLAAAPAVVTRTRYDANENRVLTLWPEAVAGRQVDNVLSAVYDERDLLAERARGGIPSGRAALAAHAALGSIWSALPLEARASAASLVSAVRTAYDANTNPVTVVDAQDHGASDTEGGDVTGTVYDGFDRPVAVTDPLGNRTETAYDPASNVVGVIARGAPGVVAGAADAKGSTENVRLSEGRFTWDELSRQTEEGQGFFVTDAAAEKGDLALYTARTFYDRLSRVVRTVEPDGDATLLEYDGLDRRVRTVDALANEVVREYDDAGNEVRRVEVERTTGVTPPEVFYTEFRLDALGRQVLSVDNLGNAERREYDSR